MKKFKSWHALAILALLFFLLTFRLGEPAGGLWNSPDETANAYWAGQVADGGPLVIRDQAVGLGNGAVHPRSMAVVGDALAPGSFPGLFILYGGIKFFTGAPLWSLTPLLTALAGLALFAALKKAFSDRIAFWSAALFYLHPAVIYYSSRGLFHNVLFVDLLIFSAYFFLVRPFGSRAKARPAFDWIIGGGLLGFALITRTSEAPWTLLGAAVLFAMAGKERWRMGAWALVGLAVPAFTMLNLNAILYGSPFALPYVAPAPALAPAVAQGEASQAAAAVGSLLPFGLHPRQIALNVIDYGLGIFWWFTALAALGVLVFLARWKKSTPSERTVFWIATGTAVWLALFYGSWYVRDNPDPTLVTIGTSYVRYFLPAFVLFLPWAAGGLVWSADRLVRWKKSAAVVLAVLVAVLSICIAVVSGNESMLSIRQTLKLNALKKPALLAEIPSGAVIMTERFDKVLFPERVRIIPLTDAASFSALSVLLNYLPAYYYGPDLSSDGYAALKRTARAYGLVLEIQTHPVSGETLYVFSRI